METFLENVMRKSEALEDYQTEVRGFDFSQKEIKIDDFFSAFLTTGFQATELSRAKDIINEMLEKRAEMNSNSGNERPFKLFLAYTSNMASSGIRDLIRYLAQNSLIDVLVTSAGGVEEDLIKCLAPFYVGDFEKIRGHQLRDKGINRIGNIYVPNDNYIKFEEWIHPILTELTMKQNDSLKNKSTEYFNLTPSKLINILGEKINNPDSIYYWAFKNQIPVFCPGITDGSLGDMMFSHVYKMERLNLSPLKLDVIEDIKRINNLSIFSQGTGMIVLGGGIAKHHTFNANLMRNGADFTVLINTAQSFDGSDSGAPLDESVSWGKVSKNSKSIKICGDATILFPLLASQTFHKYLNKKST